MISIHFATTDGFINCTPHPIDIHSANGGTYHIPPSGFVIRVTTVQTDAFTIKNDCAGDITVIRQSYGPLDIPAELTQKLHEEPSAMLLVSSMVLDALSNDDSDINRWLKDFCYAPDTGSTCIRDIAGKIIAVKRLIAPNQGD